MTFEEMLDQAIALLQRRGARPLAPSSNRSSLRAPIWQMWRTHALRNNAARWMREAATWSRRAVRARHPRSRPLRAAGDWGLRVRPRVQALPPMGSGSAASRRAIAPFLDRLCWGSVCCSATRAAWRDSSGRRHHGGGGRQRQSSTQKHGSYTAWPRA